MYSLGQAYHKPQFLGVNNCTCLTSLSSRESKLASAVCIHQAVCFWLYVSLLSTKYIFWVMHVYLLNQIASCLRTGQCLTSVPLMSIAEYPEYSAQNWYVQKMSVFVIILCLVFKWKDFFAILHTYSKNFHLTGSLLVPPALYRPFDPRVLSQLFPALF